MRIKMNMNKNPVPPTRIILNLLSALVLAAAVIAGSGCGTSKDLDKEKEIKNIEKTERLRAVREQKQKEIEAMPKRKPRAPEKSFIKKASFTPHKVKAGTALKMTVETIFPEKSEEDYYFSYIYWKNAEKITETREDTLGPENYKKGDLVFADVILFLDGEMVEKTRSETVQIVNSSPVIKGVIIPEIPGPGTYDITVNGQDIDGDKIKYSLLPPPGEGETLWEGLTINSASGTVNCTLGEKPPPEKMKFIIQADDGDGGVTKKIVTVNFKLTATVKQEEKKEKEKEKENERQ